MKQRHLLRTLGITSLVLAAAVLLAACGSSSSGSSTTATTAAQAATTAPQGGKRFSALRECLSKNGIQLPQRKAGQRPPNGQGGAQPFSRGAFGGAPRLPKGVTRAQFEAAMKKCGGTVGRFGAQGARVNSPQFKAALAQFAACMRTNGVALPAPNTSGKGPIFDTKGINTNSPTWQAAQKKCSPVLHLGAAPGAQQPPGQAAPPTQ